MLADFRMSVLRSTGICERPREVKVAERLRRLIIFRFSAALYCSRFRSGNDQLLWYGPSVAQRVPGKSWKSFFDLLGRWWLAEFFCQMLNHLLLRRIGIIRRI